MFGSMNLDGLFQPTEQEGGENLVLNATADWKLALELFSHWPLPCEVTQFPCSGQWWVGFSGSFH